MSRKANLGAFEPPGRRLGPARVRRFAVAGWLALAGLAPAALARPLRGETGGWGEIPAAAGGPSIYRADLLALVLMCLCLLLALTLGLLRQKWDLVRWWREPEDERDLERLVRSTESFLRPLLWITYLVAPALGIFGTLIGRGTDLFGIDTPLVITLLSLAVLLSSALVLLAVGIVRRRLRARLAGFRTVGFRLPVRSANRLDSR